MEDSRTDETKVLMVSSSGFDRAEARVSSSAYDTRYFMHQRVLQPSVPEINNNCIHNCVIRRGALERNSSRLTSTVKPLMEASEAVIDIKPEMYDDLISEDPLDVSTNHSRARSRPTAEIYRPGQSKFASVSSVDAGRATAESSHNRQQDNRSSRPYRTGSSKVQHS